MADTDALPRWKKNLRRDMASNARGTLGRGYVSDYYEQAASDFVWTAEQAIEDALARRGDFTDVPTALPPDVEAFREALARHFEKGAESSTAAPGGAIVARAIAETIRTFQP